MDILGKKINEIYSATLKIDGNAFVFDGKVYQVRNISSAEAESFSIKRPKRGNFGRFKDVLSSDTFINFITILAVLAVAISIGMQLTGSISPQGSEHIALFAVFWAVFFFIPLVIVSVFIFLWILITKEKDRYRSICCAKIAFIDGIILAFVSDKDFAKKAVLSLYDAISKKNKFRDKLTVDFKEKRISLTTHEG